MPSAPQVRLETPPQSGRYQGRGSPQKLSTSERASTCDPPFPRRCPGDAPTLAFRRGSRAGVHERLPRRRPETPSAGTPRRCDGLLAARAYTARSGSSEPSPSWLPEIEHATSKSGSSWLILRPWHGGKRGDIRTHALRRTSQNIPPVACADSGQCGQTADISGIRSPTTGSAAIPHGRVSAISAALVRAPAPPRDPLRFQAPRPPTRSQ